MNNEPQKREEQEATFREFLEYQKLELANKREELVLRREEIRSNEAIALASISAQKEDILKRGEVFAATHRSRLRLVGFIAALVALVIIAAMWLDKAEIALEFIKIGGGVLLGYIAGVSQGKAKALENMQRKDRND